MKNKPVFLKYGSSTYYCVKGILITVELCCQIIIFYTFEVLHNKHNSLLFSNIHSQLDSVFKYTLCKLEYSFQSLSLVEMAYLTGNERFWGDMFLL